MDINLHLPIGHRAEFSLEEEEIGILTLVLNKVVPIIEDSRKSLGFASKKRLNAAEIDFLVDFTDRLNAVNKHIQNGKVDE